MKYRSFILNSAKKDLHEAAKWYNQENKTLIVIAILHTSRNPEIWKNQKME